MLFRSLIPCNVIPDEILTDHPDRFRAMIIESGNPVHSLADSPRMREALDALELVVVIDVAILVGWIVVLVVNPVVGVILAVPALVVAVVPDIIAYVAIHLRYDTTWYVLTDRSLRIRRKIATIQETTITFENVQNVTIREGPIQRLFGIADRKSTRLNSSHSQQSRMPSSA